MTSIYFKNAPEYKQFAGLNNIYFHIHKTYSKGGQRERHVTHYPLARMIARGDLARRGVFKTFEEESTILLCNAKIYTKRFDILAITKDSDILLIECKFRTRSEKSRRQALSKIGKATEQLNEYCSAFIDFASSINGNYIQEWSNVINHRYRKFGFPSLQERLSTVIGLQNEAEQERWAIRVTDNIKAKRFSCGLAINESPDGEVASYSTIPVITLLDSARKHWNKKYGNLMLFKVDHLKDAFRLF